GTGCVDGIAVASAPGHGAPILTQSVRSRTSSGFSFPIGGIFRFSSYPMARSNRLFSGLPRSINEPLCPPARKPEADERSREAVFVFALWHIRQFWAKTGRIFFSKKSAC